MERYKLIGTLLVSEKDILNIYEGLYLLEKNKIIIVDKNEKELKIEDLLKNNIIKKGYIIYKYFKENNIKFGAGMKFGGIFRVYEDEQDKHSRWICFPVYKDEKFTIYDFLAKNRVAHSTRKTLLIAVIDRDNVEKFLEIKWKRL